jgi:hypothetical protein
VAAAVTRVRRRRMNMVLDFEMGRAVEKGAAPFLGRIREREPERVAKNRVSHTFFSTVR